jgi:hypothetical protein
MKKWFLLFVFGMGPVALLAQQADNDYMAKLAQEACTCLSVIPDSLDVESLNMKLGLCMLEKAQPYEKQLKKDYGINFDKIDEDGEKLGRLIGIKMVSYCPDAVIKLSQRNQPASATPQGEQQISGQLIKIEEEPFVQFHLRDANGKVVRFYWLTFVESHLDMLEDYKSLLTQTLSFKYVVQEFFDPRVGEYRNFNILTWVGPAE